MPEPSGRHPAVITVDVEDWPQSTWDRSLPISPRAADNTLRLLERLERLNVRATMFVLGNFTRRFPEVVRAIDAAGHEVACHGSDHAAVTAQSPAEFREDVRSARRLLEDTTSRPVVGYRAPDFSIVRESLWALGILAEEGFAYDSSIYPIRGGRYGIEDWPQRPTRLRLQGGGTIVEFPLSTVRWRGRNWPVAGGGYHRLLPGPLARFFAGHVVRSRPFVFYCHPYEFDPGEFSALSFPIPMKTRLHQGLGRGRFAARFESFAVRFGGSTRLVDLCDSVSDETPRVLAGMKLEAGRAR
jgi:polysaccharide deacetylase family protein (PEP-CTERM system associated)